MSSTKQYENVTLMYMAPVARTIAAAKKDRLIFSFGFSEGFFAPGVPIYGIIAAINTDSSHSLGGLRAASSLTITSFFIATL